MSEIICAMAGMALGGGLMALGYALGRIEWSGPCRCPAEIAEAAVRPAAGETPSGEGPQAEPAKAPRQDPGPRERALERLEADQRAFSALMGYSADVAYGLIKSPLREE